MVSYLSKSDASKGFNQIIDFLNGSSIKYALTVNPNIYVSCIKQFWNTVVVKQVNDITRLQAIVDKKKVVIIEAAIREVLRLDDEEGMDCLPNEEIFTELARIRYEKPSTKLMFYKAFFSSHLVRNVDSNTKFYMYPRFLQLVIIRQVGDLSTHTTKYALPALTQKIEEKGDAYEHVEEVTVGGDAHRDDSAAHGEVPTVTKEPSIPSPTPPTPPPQPPQDIPLTSQVQQIPPQSPQVQPPSPPPQPQQAADFPMTQALEIIKLKRKVKKLEKRNKVRVLKLRRLQRVGTSQRVDTSDDTVMDDESNQERMIAEMDKDDEDETEPAEVQEVVDVVTTAKLITEVVTAASETVTAANAIIPTVEPQVSAATLTAAPTRVAAAPTIDHVKLKAKEDPAIKRYQAMKRKPQTEAQARKNLMMYLKNVDGFKLDYFKGMSYDDIRPIFEDKFNSNVDFLLKTKE
nr:xylulose kinase-1 [Tanacetum cinerariifolium]